VHRVRSPRLRLAVRAAVLRLGGDEDYAMTGLDTTTPRPTEIKLHQASRVLEITFDDGKSFRFPYEFLRVYSPSAEVRGHGPGQEVLQIGKRDVTISNVEPVGHYALRPRFSDGHDSGIYSWDYLYALGEEQDALWQRYLDRMTQAGAKREP
jgi:DUF971 family protein